MSGIAMHPLHERSELEIDHIDQTVGPDPFRWLETQDSPRTRQWLELQSGHLESYLRGVPSTPLIRKRVRELLTTTSFDSAREVNGRYFFRKRLPGQEQPCICMREGRE